MSRPRKRPMRMCTGCREMFDKRDLVRIVRTPEGEIKMDLTGKANGRGAYVCKKKTCVEKAIKSKQLAKTLQAQIPSDIIDLLVQEFKEIE